MRKFIITLVVGFIVVVALALVADLHCRVIELEQNLEYTRSQVQELQEAVFEGDNVIEVGYGGWLRKVDWEEANVY